VHPLSLKISWPLLAPVRTLLYSDSLKEWECATSVSTKINLWEKEAQESRAMNNFAKANGMQRSRVTLEKVKESDLGLEGWTTYDDKQQARGPGVELLWQVLLVHLLGTRRLEQPRKRQSTPAALNPPRRQRERKRRLIKRKP